MNRKKRRKQQALRRAQKPNEILTPASPRWDEFVAALDAVLEQPPYCDGDYIQAGDKVHRHAKRIMANMGGINIAGSLAFFASKGGHCDCEILLNLDL
jgi:Protein of unknown function (DUF2695)